MYIRIALEFLLALYRQEVFKFILPVNGRFCQAYFETVSFLSERIRRLEGKTQALRCFRKTISETLLSQFLWSKKVVQFSRAANNLARL